MATQDWANNAACAGMDARIFYPLKGGTGRAKATCAQCLVRTACLQWALANGATTGIWGGLTAVERRKHKGTT